ncbi:MAG TPA: TlpA disulfide reductase family protein [Nocardioides sp.]|nr:TlpA disulfide reductase family protein [Nocardioides sp.]
MRVLAALVAVLALLVGCDEVPPPGKTDVDVDTEELRHVKDRAGIEDCQEGPGGGELPELTLPCLGGGTDVDLSTLRGPMVINTWASNCGPCIKEMPALQQFHQMYGDQVAVLGIDFLDTQPGAALALAEETGATYPSLADPDGQLLEQDGLRLAGGNPQFLLLDADGAVAHQQAGGLESVDEVIAMVNEHLGTRL